MQTTGEATTRRARRARPRRRVSVLGVIGELFITVGAVVLLYVAWQMWIGDVIYGAQGQAQARELSQQWAQADDPVLPTEEPADTATEAPAAPATIEPVVMPPPEGTEDFGVMYIPRLGADYHWTIAGGVTRSGTLDHQRIGHYPGSAMPGEVGNFAVAAHRTTYGAPFNRLADLHVGDAIVVETQEGWYTYRFRTLEYVEPDAVDVLLDVPRKPDVAAGERYITLTSCSPMYAMTERIVGYGLFESFTPRSAGAPPSSLTEAAA